MYVAKRNIFNVNTFVENGNIKQISFRYNTDNKQYPHHGFNNYKRSLLLLL